jgi:hypothetical protein
MLEVRYTLPDTYLTNSDYEEALEYRKNCFSLQTTNDLSEYGASEYQATHDENIMAVRVSGSR